MKDLGQALLTKQEAIIEAWIKAVRADKEIKSAKELSFNSVRDSIPFVLEAIASLLTQSISNQPHKLKKKGLVHGLVRAEQGYDAAEVIREYRILREKIFSQLEPELLSGSASELLETVKVIDSSLDAVITVSLEYYIDGRVQEYISLQDQLLLTNQELTRLVKTQQDNFSHLSHELKNPLTSIMGFSELLLKQRESQDTAVDQEQPDLDLQLIERVLSNSHQLLCLINNASEVSRFESDQVELDLKTIDVGPLISSATRTLENPHQEDIEVIIDCDRAPQQVQTDPLRLQQIVTNIVGNALRYTETGTIHVTCQISGQDRWSLVVADTGRGISPEDQTHVFEPYFRAGSEKDYVPQSTGLGLAIVAKLVKLLNGEIELVSEIDKGSVFTFIFPFESSAP